MSDKFLKKLDYIMGWVIFILAVLILAGFIFSSSMREGFSDTQMEIYKNREDKVRNRY